MKELQLDNGKTITIKKLGIGKYKDLFASLKELPALVADLDKVDTDTIVARIPKIVATSIDEFADVVNYFVVGLSKEELLEVGLDEFVKIVELILEVNNAEYILATLKKAMAVRANR